MTDYYRIYRRIPIYVARTVNILFHAAALAVFAAFTAVSSVFNKTGAALLAGGLVLGLAAMVLAGKRDLLGGGGRYFRYFRWYAISVIIMGIFFFRTYTGLGPGDCDMDPAQVETYFSTGQCGGMPGGEARDDCLNFTRDPYDIVSAGDRLAVAYTGKGRGVLLFRPDAPGDEFFFRFGRKERGPIRLLYDSARGLLVAGMNEPEIVYFIETEQVSVARKVRLAAGEISDAAMLDGDYFLLSERGFFHRVRGADFSVESVPVRGAGGKLYSIAVNPRNRKVYMNHWAGSNVIMYDADTLEYVSERDVGFGGGELEIDPAGGALLVSQPLRSRILVLDADTLEPKREIPAGYGLRDLELDPASGKLHSVNYFEGTYKRINYKTGETERTLRVGKLPRAVHFDAATGNVYVVSTCGIFRILPD